MQGCIFVVLVTSCVSWQSKVSPDMCMSRDVCAFVHRMCAELQGKVDEFEHKAAALAKAESASVAGGSPSASSRSVEVFAFDTCRLADRWDPTRAQGVSTPHASDAVCTSYTSQANLSSGFYVHLCMTGPRSNSELLKQKLILKQPKQPESLPSELAYT